MNAFPVLAEICRRLVEQAAFFTGRELVLAGSRIRVCCVDFDPPGLMFASISNLLSGEEVRETGSPANKEDRAQSPETFYCISRPSAELKAVLPEEFSGKNGRILYSGEEGRYAVSAEFGFFSLYERAGNATYIWICPDMHALDSFVSHPFHMELGWWALRNGLLFLHSAAVGAGGKGVLISGAGGSGKSTLAMTSYLAGMSLLSDDYLLVRNDPLPTAERIYSTAYLKSDMLAKLPELEKAVVWTCRERDKHLVGLDLCAGTVADTLPLNAIVLPDIAHARTPQIIRNPDIRTRIPLIASTSYQNRELKNREVFMKMMHLLRSIPAYDFLLTDDLRANADYLADWLEGRTEEDGEWAKK